MTGFNLLYYTFSLHIANMERENPLFKEMVKIVIIPLLSTLSIMSYAESESEVVGYSIGVILMNLGIYSNTSSHNFQNQKIYQNLEKILRYCKSQLI